jgi:hypothetical protein
VRATVIGWSKKANVRANFRPKKIAKPFSNGLERIIAKHTI